MDAAIDGIVRRGAKKADGGGADDASASESDVSDASESGVSDARSLVAATIARRASAEPAFADTHAAIVAGLADTRVAREIVRATRLRVRNALDGRRSKEAAREDPTATPRATRVGGGLRSPRSGGGAFSRRDGLAGGRGGGPGDGGREDARGGAPRRRFSRHPSFGVVPSSERGGGGGGPSGARRTPSTRARSRRNASNRRRFLLRRSRSRARSRRGRDARRRGSPDVAKALEAMARRRARRRSPRRRGATERRGASADRRAAPRSSRSASSSSWRRSVARAARQSGVPEVPEVLRSSNRAMTRAEVHAAFVAEGAPRSVKSDYPRAEKADAYSRKNGDERDAALVSTSRRVVAVEGSAAAVERGMRRGWVFWYAGSPVVRFPDAKPFVFDAESAAGFHSRERGDADAGSDDDADPRRFRREDGGKRSPSRGPRRRFVPAPVGATWPTEGAVHRV